MWLSSSKISSHPCRTLFLTNWAEAPRSALSKDRGRDVFPYNRWSTRTACQTFTTSTIFDSWDVDAALILSCACAWWTGWPVAVDLLSVDEKVGITTSAEVGLTLGIRKVCAFRDRAWVREAVHGGAAAVDFFSTNREHRIASTAQVGGALGTRVSWAVGHLTRVGFAKSHWHAWFALSWFGTWTRVATWREARYRTDALSCWLVNNTVCNYNWTINGCLFNRYYSVTVRKNTLTCTACH